MHRHLTENTDSTPWKIKFCLARLKTQLGTVQILYIFLWAGPLTWGQHALPDTVHTFG